VQNLDNSVIVDCEVKQFNHLLKVTLKHAIVGACLYHNYSLYFYFEYECVCYRTEAIANHMIYPLC